jgi:hypothetical protein
MLVIHRRPSEAVRTDTYAEAEEFSRNPILIREDEIASS